MASRGFGRGIVRNCGGPVVEAADAHRRLKRPTAFPRRAATWPSKASPTSSVKFGLGDYEIDLRRTDATGKPFRDLSKLAAAEPFILAMNAGMYHEDFTPVGLHVENGTEQSPLNLADAPGNFFLKPNGVFYVDGDNNAGVLETTAFAAAGIVPKLATQSGPMLVIDGNIHPRFEENGTSRHIRNGVGADGGQTGGVRDLPWTGQPRQLRPVFPRCAGLQERAVFRWHGLGASRRPEVSCRRRVSGRADAGRKEEGGPRQ